MRSIDLAASLSAVEQALHRLGRATLLQALQSGLSAEGVRAILAAVELPFRLELEELYGWRDGTGPDVGALDDIHLFPGFYLLSLEEAVDDYRTFLSDGRWSPGWLPIFANGGGDFYVVDLSTPGHGAVRHFWLEESDHPIEFVSLSTMLATLAQCFERGIFYVDPSGYLEMDDLAFGSVAAELNPEVAYWRELT